MKDYDPNRENDFFALFQEYFDLEKDVGKQHDTQNYSLDRMYPLAALAGNPERKLKIIHVAGTKGKGSTSFYLTALLNAAGKSCGVFTSPHLLTVRERFQINNRLLSYDALEAAAIPLCQRLKAAGLKPSLFEIFTVLALQIFAQAGVEYAVLETGIGGTLDATNYVPEKVATVITPLSYDHTALLGNTIEEIAAQKAGILRQGVPLILAKQPYPAAEQTVINCAKQLHAPIFRPDLNVDINTWIPNSYIPFLQENFQVALRTIEVLGLQPVPAHFHAPVLRARFEVLRHEPPVILDAAHNGDSARQLARAVAACYPGRHFLCVLGSVPGKDVRGIAQGLQSMDAEFLLTNPDTPRGSALPQLLDAARECNLKIFGVKEHITSPNDLPTDLPLLFTGSFFTALIGAKLFG